MKIKVCGITRYEDLKNCEDAGVDLVGFINIPRSKRFIDVPQIKSMISSMDHDEKAVLVLETDDLEEIIMKIKKTGIRTVQLHSLSPGQIKYLKWIESYQRDPFQRTLSVINVIGISPDSVKSKNDDDLILENSKKNEIQDFAKICDALLFDYQIDGKTGGTGKQIPLKIVLEAVKIAKNINKGIKIFLAGGVNSKMIKNNRDLFDKIFDYVDVNSGVEDAPGIKNPNLVQELIEDKN